MTVENDIPWPDWVLRFIAADNEESFMDAIWSVGGSPPYGGVSYEEAAAVYYLLEDYRGPGMAGEKLYEDVRGFIRRDPYRQAVLDIFYVNDQEVGRVTDDTFSRGDIGLMVRTLGAGGVHVQFDNYSVTPIK